MLRTVEAFFSNVQEGLGSPQVASPPKVNSLVYNPIVRFASALTSSAYSTKLPADNTVMQTHHTCFSKYTPCMQAVTLLFDNLCLCSDPDCLPSFPSSDDSPPLFSLCLFPNFVACVPPPLLFLGLLWLYDFALSLFHLSHVLPGFTQNKCISPTLWFVGLPGAYRCTFCY